MSILEKKVTGIEEGTKIREYLKMEMGWSTRLIRSASIDKRIFVNRFSKRWKSRYCTRKDGYWNNIWRWRYISSE